MQNNFYNYKKLMLHPSTYGALLLVILLGFIGIDLEGTQPADYPIHQVIASIFYVGEPSDSDNDYISNLSSAWDDNWTDHYGGMDDPAHRSGLLPMGFHPKQNPFYVALPYNDLDDAGNTKPTAKQIYWYDPYHSGESQLKNRWIEVCHDGTCAYGQWEDVGPFGEDDANYVFGNAAPSNTEGLHAGIDVSPALNGLLKLNGDATVTWQFVQEAQVPAGPWKDIITHD